MPWVFFWMLAPWDNEIAQDEWDTFLAALSWDFLLYVLVFAAVICGLYAYYTRRLTHALAAYKRALAVEPRQIDLRLKMIRLLQAQGELEQAIQAYEGIVRAA